MWRYKKPLLWWLIPLIVISSLYQLSLPPQFLHPRNVVTNIYLFLLILIVMWVSIIQPTDMAELVKYRYPTIKKYRQHVLFAKVLDSVVVVVLYVITNNLILIFRVKHVFLLENIYYTVVLWGIFSVLVLFHMLIPKKLSKIGSAALFMATLLFFFMASPQFSFNLFSYLQLSNVTMVSFLLYTVLVASYLGVGMYLLTRKKRGEEGE